VGEVLGTMGVTDASDMNRADFSGMDGRKLWLYISAVLHQAFVRVDEEGSEAAAATAVMVTLGARPTRSAVFRADRPFLFFIREKETGSVLFLGRVVDPRPET